MSYGINTFRKGKAYEETDVSCIHFNKMEENILIARAQSIKYPMRLRIFTEHT